MSTCNLHRVIRPIVVAAFAATALFVTTPAPSSADSLTPCYEVGVAYLGRTPVANLDGVQYYRWSYRVCGGTCINRALSHWTLGLCLSTQQQISGVSTYSFDASDNSNGTNGTMAHYISEIGLDPTTGISGLKWNFSGGNAVDRTGECDEFSFVATGGETIVNWTSKGASFVTTGTTIGPGCGPVPVELKSWSSIKSLSYR